MKVTLIMQLAELARLVPQLLLWAKSPEALIELIDIDALPVFVNVTVCAVLVVFCCCVANVRFVGETVAAGAAALPFKLIL